ncbi:Polar-differentiation response regulator DivK [compost metagenome]
MNGYEALEELRRREETRHIPVLAVSSFAQKSDIEKGIQAGFADYITKPFQVKAFKSLIEQWIKI